MLDYEKLQVYRDSIVHLEIVMRALPQLPRGYSALADQWRRASMSIPLNIAEAVGKRDGADRQNRYAIARGEAMECGAIVDVVRLIRAVDDAELDKAKAALERVVAMLTSLCR